MRWIVFTVTSFLCAGPLRGGSVEPFGGEITPGKVELDFGGIVFRPTQGAVIKLDFNNLYRVQFDGWPTEECVPGVALRDGTRLAAPYGALTDPVVKFPKRNISI